MTKARLIWACACAAVAALVCAFVCAQWAAQGCGVWSLVAACGWYAACITAIWAVIDDVIKEAQK